MRRIAVVTCAAVLSLAILAVGSRGPSDAPPLEQIFTGVGVRLSVYGGPAIVTISAEQPCWLRGGFWTPVQAGAVGVMQDMFPDVKVAGFGLGGLYLNVWIDGKPLKLNKQMFWTSSPPGPFPGGDVDTNVDTKWNVWYYQFPPGYFEPGEYFIEGELGTRNKNNPEVYYSGLPWRNFFMLCVE